MKITKKVQLMFIILAFIGVSGIHAKANISISANFSELDGYGEWITVPEYGSVWRPDASPDWRPFTYGHWVYTDDGWLWDSDEPFGWIVNHYGNWAYDDDEGWIWLPGYTWSPARVSWHVTNDEIGWAPILPKLRRGHSYNRIQMQWNFASSASFTSVDIRNNISIRSNLNSGAIRTKIHAGPPRREYIQRSVNAPIKRVSINRIKVSSRNKPLIRIEIPNRERSNVEVPVGHKYKRVKVEEREKVKVKVRD